MSQRQLRGAALVTGAGSGIGRAVALALSKAEIDMLYLTDLNQDALDDTRKTISNRQLPGRNCVAIPGDISSPEFIAELFERIPSLDYAVNCAGVLGVDKPTTEVSLEEFDALNSVNYRGMWMCAKEELKLMLKNQITPYLAFTQHNRESWIRGQRGAIVHIASQLGIVSRPQASIYSASKAAVLAMTRSDAVDYSTPSHRIRVNAICPGVISTGMTTDENGNVSERLQDAIAIAPMNRIGLASEVADTAMWLLSGEASFVTGQGIVVDGGYVVN